MHHQPGGSPVTARCDPSNRVFVLSRSIFYIYETLYNSMASTFIKQQHSGSIDCRLIHKEKGKLNHALISYSDGPAWDNAVCTVHTPLCVCTLTNPHHQKREKPRQREKERSQSTQRAVRPNGLSTVHIRTLSSTSRESLLDMTQPPADFVESKSVDLVHNLKPTFSLGSYWNRSSIFTVP